MLHSAATTAVYALFALVVRVSIRALFYEREQVGHELDRDAFPTLECAYVILRATLVSE